MMLAPMLALTAAIAAQPAAEPRNRDVSDGFDLRRWYDHGRCLVEAEGAVAERVLAAPPESRSSFRAFLEADASARCFREDHLASPRLHTNAIRGAIVEALLKRDFTETGLPRRRGSAPVFDIEAPAEEAPKAPGFDRAMAFLRFAECVFAVDPAQSVAVFRTEVGTPAERSAVRRLMPSMSACLTQGELSLQAPILRSYLAEAAYRAFSRGVRIVPPTATGQRD